MRKGFLLKTKNAKNLYENVAKNLPIIDFHNHVCVGDIVTDKKYNDISELWITSDPYKHRLMRIRGVSEKFITGDADPFDKFNAFCLNVPFLAGNPVYDWCKMELSSLFNIDKQINSKNAKYIFDECNEKLSSSEFSNNNILKRFNIEYQSPVASLLDDLTIFNGRSVAPSLRGDNLLEPTTELKERLQEKTGVVINDDSTYIKAVSTFLDEFSKRGCRFVDHALDDGFFDDGNENKIKILSLLATEYAKRGFTLLLHIDAKRQTSDRLLKLAGPAGGYASVGGRFNISKLCSFLGSVERDGKLPDTIIFPLNMVDQTPIAVMQGSFSEDNTPSKVSLGPAWWWCDHKFGIENTLNNIASFGVLSEFIGMTTDSRSILSFVRHDYFRRIFCSYIDSKNTIEEWNMPKDIQREIVKKVCYQNAKNKIVKGDNYGEI